MFLGMYMLVSFKQSRHKRAQTHTPPHKSRIPWNTYMYRWKLCSCAPLPCLFESGERFRNEGAEQALVKSFKFQMHEVIMPVN